MGALSYKKLDALRSGHTVWRVWGHSNEQGVITVDVTRYFVMGKKVLHWHSKENGGHSALRMISSKVDLSSPESYIEDTRRGDNRARFLGDLRGLGCFRSVRQAERFAKDINEGRYPEIVQWIIERDQDDAAFQEWADEIAQQEFDNIPL